MATARSSVARASPTLPPSAINASAMARAQDGDADVAEDRGDRCMRLVHGDAHRGDARKARQDLVRDRAGRSLDQPKALRREGAGRRLDDARVGDGVDELVAHRCLTEIEHKLEVDGELLPDLLLVPHHPVVGMDEQAGDEDGIAHASFRIAATTLSACTVSATSCTRTIAAPSSTASTCAAIEPPIRRS